MNPSCRTNIKSSECQNWMSEVCTRCKELFDEEAKDQWADWWHDSTPAIYKPVPEMTVYDCNKLKLLLQREVASIEPRGAQATDNPENKMTRSHMLLLFVFYAGTIIAVYLLYSYWKKKRRDNTIVDIGNAESKEPVIVDTKEKTATPTHPKLKSSNTMGKSKPQNQMQSQPESQPKRAPTSLRPYTSDKKPVMISSNKNENEGFKSWVRHRCRQLFVHNQAELQKRQKKYREKQKVRDAITKKNVEKWTKTIDQRNKQKMYKLAKQNNAQKNNNIKDNSNKNNNIDNTKDKNSERSKDKSKNTNKIKKKSTKKNEDENNTKELSPTPTPNVDTTAKV